MQTCKGERSRKSLPSMSVCCCLGSGWIERYCNIGYCLSCFHELQELIFHGFIFRFKFFRQVQVEYFGINGERRDEELVFCDFTCKPMYIKMLYVCMYSKEKHQRQMIIRKQRGARARKSFTQGQITYVMIIKTHRWAVEGQESHLQHGHIAYVMIINTYMRSVPL